MAEQSTSWEVWAEPAEPAEGEAVFVIPVGGAIPIAEHFAKAGLPAGWTGLYAPDNPDADVPELVEGGQVLVLRESFGDREKRSWPVARACQQAKAIRVLEYCLGWGWEEKTWNPETIEGLLEEAASNPEPAIVEDTPDSSHASDGGKVEAGELLIDFVPAGRKGTATLTARPGDEVIAIDTVNLTRAKAREKFVSQLCDGRPGIDAAAVDAALRQAAVELTKRPPGRERATVQEVEVSDVARPERFVLPEVSGLAVPTMVVADKGVEGRWVWYLRWADGERERRPSGASLDLPGGGKLWMYPQPSDPAANARPGWSTQARQQWLGGKAAPNGADLFARLCERIAYYLDLPADTGPGVTATLALWSMMTYIYQVFDAVPYLYVGGPLGSGKSRVFEILSRLVFRPLSSSNMTAPSLFRTLHDRGGVLLLDEAERLKQTRDPDVGELLSAMLAGYKRGGCAIRLEPVGDNGFRPVSFNVYGPKASACIAGLPPALASRSIAVPMFRALPGSEKPRRRIDGDPAGWQRLRDDLHALAMEHGEDWLELPERTDVCPSMSGRDFELWQPLLSLAAWIEECGAEGLLELMRGHAQKVIDHGQDDRTPEADEILLRLLAQAVRNGERPTPHEVLERAQQAEQAMFRNWYPRTVTAKLKAYGIPTPRKSGSRREFRDVTNDLLRRVQQSYGIDLELPNDDEPGRVGPSQPS